MWSDSPLNAGTLSYEQTGVDEYGVNINWTNPPGTWSTGLAGTGGCLAGGEGYVDFRGRGRISGHEVACTAIS